MYNTYNKSALILCKKAISFFIRTAEIGWAAQLRSFSDCDISIHPKVNSKSILPKRILRFDRKGAKVRGNSNVKSAEHPWRAFSAIFLKVLFFSVRAAVGIGRRVDVIVDKAVQRRNRRVHIGVDTGRLSDVVAIGNDIGVQRKTGAVHMEPAEKDRHQAQQNRSGKERYRPRLLPSSA